MSGVGTWLNLELESTIVASVEAGFKLTVSNLEFLTKPLKSSWSVLKSLPTFFCFLGVLSSSALVCPGGNCRLMLKISDWVMAVLIESGELGSKRFMKLITGSSFFILASIATSSASASVVGGNGGRNSFEGGVTRDELVGKFFVERAVVCAKRLSSGVD